MKESTSPYYSGSSELSWGVQFTLDSFIVPLGVLKTSKKKPVFPVSTSLAQYPLVKFLLLEHEPYDLKNKIF